ncbi:MAG: hypothetical protein ACI8UD_004365 [Planctomycetota bacterium]|jgi:hypothetical protein
MAFVSTVLQVLTVKHSIASELAIAGRIAARRTVDIGMARQWRQHGCVVLWQFVRSMVVVGRHAS